MTGEKYTYLYPNQKSYALLPVNRQHGGFTWQGRSLRHGYIYGYKAAAASEYNVLSSAPLRGRLTTFRQIDYTNYKIFQFNPPGLTMNVTMMNVDSPENEAEGGALGSPAVGLATSGLELFFDRTDEIARRTRLAPLAYTEIRWRDLGVQVDLFDFLKVISGGDSPRWAVTATPTGWRRAATSERVR